MCVACLERAEDYLNRLIGRATASPSANRSRTRPRQEGGATRASSGARRSSVVTPVYDTRRAFARSRPCRRPARHRPGKRAGISLGARERRSRPAPLSSPRFRGRPRSRDLRLDPADRPPEALCALPCLTRLAASQTAGDAAWPRSGRGVKRQRHIKDFGLGGAGGMGSFPAPKLPLPPPIFYIDHTPILGPPGIESANPAGTRRADGNRCRDARLDLELTRTLAGAPGRILAGNHRQDCHGAGQLACLPSAWRLLTRPRKSRAASMPSRFLAVNRGCARRCEPASSPRRT